jgi:hypothetical protein
MNLDLLPGFPISLVGFHQAAVGLPLALAKLYEQVVPCHWLSFIYHYFYF